MSELATDDGGDAQHLERILVECIEPRADDGLHRVGQLQRRDAAGDNAFAAVSSRLRLLP